MGVRSERGEVRAGAGENGRGARRESGLKEEEEKRKTQKHGRRESCNMELWYAVCPDLSLKSASLRSTRLAKATVVRYRYPVAWNSS